MQPYNPYLPPELYVWIVTQDGEDRIRKWDIKPFDEATHICKQNAEKLTDAPEHVNKTSDFEHTELLEKSHRELYEACVRTVDAIEKYPERKHPMTASEIILKIALQNAEKIIK